jgi:hypothetical protein
MQPACQFLKTANNKDLAFRRTGWTGFPSAFCRVAPRAYGKKLPVRCSVDKRQGADSRAATIGMNFANIISKINGIARAACYPVKVTAKESYGRE